MVLPLFQFSHRATPGAVEGGDGVPRCGTVTLHAIVHLLAPMPAVSPPRLTGSHHSSTPLRPTAEVLAENNSAFSHSTFYVVERHIRKANERHGMALKDLMRDRLDPVSNAAFVGKANVFISHAVRHLPPAPLPRPSPGPTNLPPRPHRLTCPPSCPPTHPPSSASRPTPCLSSLPAPGGTAWSTDAASCARHSPPPPVFQWGDSFRLLLKALRSTLQKHEKRRRGKELYFWLDIVCLDQVRAAPGTHTPLLVSLLRARRRAHCRAHAPSVPRGATSPA